MVGIRDVSPVDGLSHNSLIDMALSLQLWTLSNDSALISGQEVSRKLTDTGNEYVYSPNT